MKNNRFSLKCLIVAVLALGIGSVGSLRAGEISYGATAYGPAMIEVPDVNLVCKTANYTGGIADPDVLISYFMESGLKNMVIPGIGAKDATRIFDVVNGVSGIKVFYDNGKDNLVLVNTKIDCDYYHKHKKHHVLDMSKMIAPMGVIAEHVSGDSIISSASQAHGFVASTGTGVNFIGHDSPVIVASDYETGEGETPLYTH